MLALDPEASGCGGNASCTEPSSQCTYQEADISCQMPWSLQDPLPAQTPCRDLYGLEHQLDQHQAMQLWQAACCSHSCLTCKATL